MPGGKWKIPENPRVPRARGWAGPGEAPLTACGASAASAAAGTRPGLALIRGDSRHSNSSRHSEIALDTGSSFQGMICCGKRLYLPSEIPALSRDFQRKRDVCGRAEAGW